MMDPNIKIKLMARSIDEKYLHDKDMEDETLLLAHRIRELGVASIKTTKSPSPS